MAEIFGYAASIFVAVSLLMVSLVKLRVINLIGAVFFVVYGVLLGAWPVVATNGFIVFINMYFLFKLFKRDISRFAYECLEAKDGDLVLRFLQEKLADCQKYYPLFHPKMINLAFSGNGKVYGAFRQNRLNGLSVLLRVDALLESRPQFWDKPDGDGTQFSRNGVHEPGVNKGRAKTDAVPLPAGSESPKEKNTFLFDILSDLSKRFPPESTYYMPADYLVAKYRDLGVVGKFHQRLLADLPVEVKRIICIVTRDDIGTRRYFQRNGYEKIESRDGVTVFELDLKDMR